VGLELEEDPHLPVFEVDGLETLDEGLFLKIIKYFGELAGLQVAFVLQLHGPGSVRLFITY